MNILWIPHAGWHIPQRAHLFCRALAERHELHVTDWVADFNSITDYCTLRYARNFTYRVSRENRLTVHGIPRISPSIFSPSLRALNSRMFSWFVARIIRRHRIDAVVGTFVVPPPRTAPRLIFDLFDDNVGLWLGAGRFPGYAAEIAAREKVYLETADAVVAAGSVLSDMARKRTRRPVHCIPNGVQLSVFDAADGRRLREEWHPSGPVIGDLGNHDSPAELEKTLTAATLLADLQLTFVIAGRGRALPGAMERARREGIPNVRFVRRAPLADAPNFVRAFDVGICPYQKTAGSDARSPMRLLLYAAGGLPVVCTDLEEVRRMDFPNVVRVSDDPCGLADGVRRALVLPRARPDKMNLYDIGVLADRYEQVLRGTDAPFPSATAGGIFEYRRE